LLTNPPSLRMVEHVLSAGFFVISYFRGKGCQNRPTLFFERSPWSPWGSLRPITTADGREMLATTARGSSGRMGSTMQTLEHLSSSGCEDLL